MNTVVTSSPPVSFPAHIIKSSIGKKILMAISGFIAFGFVTGHMLGNLQVLIGQDQINSYAEQLQGLGPMLWVIRGFLLLAFVVHIWVGLLLKIQNWAARPVGYCKSISLEAGLASRTMIWTGLIVLIFFVYHILHYTVRVTHPEYASLTDSLGRPDVYSMIIHGFSNWFVSIFYLIGVGLLSYHLSHGVSSMPQTLGLNNPKWQKRLDVIAWLYMIFLFVGYAAIPVAVLSGYLTPGGGF